MSGQVCMHYSDPNTCVNCNSNYYQSLPAKLEAAEKRNKDKWISVDERLPADGASALVYVPGSEEEYLLNRVAWIDYDTNPPQWIDTGLVMDGVTHWQPLPAPPEAPSEL